jgi:acyl-CoA reductase-like NAD-dependent aldehyde dehydrogenase
MATIEKPTTYPAPGQTGSEVSLEERYENFIGGHWVAPTNGEYRDNPAPPTGEPFCQVAHSSPEDIELALDAAHAAKDAWGETSVGERAAIAFGGYKVSGVGRETHKMMLDHYTQTKCMLVSYDPKPLGFF